MAPSLGRGACQAIADALALTDAMEHTDDPAAALAAYDRTQRPVGTRLVRRSRTLLRVQLSPTPRSGAGRPAAAGRADHPTLSGPGRAGTRGRPAATALSPVGACAGRRPLLASWGHVIELEENPPWNAWHWPVNA